MKAQSPFGIFGGPITSAGPSDLYFTTASGAHPNSAGALNFGLDYADALYGLIKGL